MPGLEPLAVPHGVDVVDHVETYRIAGSDRASIGAALRVGIMGEAGTRFTGYHSWHMSWSYETHAESERCTIVRATVTLTSTVTLPVWTPPEDVDSSLVREWEEYRQALAVHERGHRAITYAGAERLVRAIQGVSDPSCAFIGRAVRAAAEPVVAEIKEEDARYDLETRHGATQGAVWRR